jgi:hypothetical protein
MNKKKCITISKSLMKMNKKDLLMYRLELEKLLSIIDKIIESKY